MSADRHLPAGPTLQIQHRTYWYISKVVKGEFINNKLPLPVIPPVVVQQMRSSTPQVVQPDHAEVTTPTKIGSDDDAAVNPAVLTPTGIELSGCSASPSTQADQLVLGLAPNGQKTPLTKSRPIFVSVGFQLTGYTNLPSILFTRL